MKKTRTRIAPGATWLRAAWFSNGKRRYANLYTIWHCMRQRCQCPTYIGYPWYGARGISICPEWDDFAVFREWAISAGFAKGLTLDRIDNDGNYGPDNCRWATREEQVYNSRQTRQITFRGETKPAPVWAKEMGLTPSQLRERLKMGWTVERALTQPLQQQSRFA